MELWGREPTCGVEKFCGSTRLWLPDGTLLPLDQSPVVDVLRTRVPAHNVEVFIERPDGSRLLVLVNFAAIKNTRGEVSGAVTSFIDITERKRAEEELRQLAADLVESDRRKNEFLAMLAHELRNPLAPIRDVSTCLNISKTCGSSLAEMPMPVSQTRITATPQPPLTKGGMGGAPDGAPPGERGVRARP